MYDLLEELEYNRKELLSKIEESKALGIDLARKERDYKVLLRKVELEYKELGVKATEMQYVLYGDERVAELREKRDVAEVLYKACQDGILAIKLNLRLLDTQISREMGSVNIE